MKTALVTGISGQGGAYLANSLLNDGYQVIGTTRDLKQVNTDNLRKLGIEERITLRALDLQNEQPALDLIDQTRPDEVYHLAAPSSVARSFAEPALTIKAIALTTVNLLEAIRKVDKNIPCFIASSTEVFGNCATPANEFTPHNPKSPYGVGKSCAHFQARNYRQAFGMYVCSGILSNFESPLRPKNYVTSKIVHTACEIALGERSNIELGNLEVRRDWGCANDFMQAVPLCLRQDNPADYLIATGQTHSLKEFLDITFSYLGHDYKEFLVMEDSLVRPLDIAQSLCDTSSTEQRLGWTAKTNLPEVILTMLKAALTGMTSERQALEILNLAPAAGLYVAAR